MANPSPQPERITLTGASGTQYQFFLYLWGTPFQALGGVYAVMRAEGNRYPIIYVGQTGDLSERCENHHQAACFSMNRKTHIAVLPENSEARRLTIETDLRRKYNPPCNQQ